MSHSFFDVDRPTVIGHRGSAGNRPENTLLSFETALAQGAQILESDIHLSRDGVPILLHDPNLDRTTDGKGDASESTWAELGALDAGIRFEDENGNTPFRGKGVRIPSLEEAFEHFPDARFNLEIKCTGLDGIRATLDLVERFDRADRTLLAAGEDEIMQDLRTALATRTIRPAVGASLSEIVAAVASALGDSEMPPGVMALQIPSTFAGQPLATREFVAHAHANGVQVHVWTVNELDEIEALLDIGVDGIVTDHPGRMTDWLKRVGRR
jgi:glycerophosphoryl diester phosphodiesterase